VKPAATLLVYDPLEWFQGPDARYWRHYVEVWRESGSRRGAAFDAQFLPRVGLPDVHDLIHANVKESRGRVFLCPAYGKMGVGRIIPDIVESLPGPLREKASHLADGPRIAHLYHRRAQPHRLPATYLPLSYFLLFTASERRTRLRPPGRPDEAGYLTELRRGRRRLARLIEAARSTGEPRHLLQEIEALDGFLGLHAEDALLELRHRLAGTAAGREDPIVAEARARVRAAGRGVLFTDGVLSGLRPT
jgi:hypothetical protein